MTARSGAVLAAVLMAGMIPGAQASAGGRDVRIDVKYGCDFPSGAKKVAVRVSATVPEEAAVDQPVQLSDVSTELTLPEAGLPDLADVGTAGVEVETQLTMGVAQGDHTASTVWIGTTGDPVAVPDTGEFTFTSSGAVPSVTAGSSGDLTFTAGKLTALLTSPKPDSASAEPSAVLLTCTPEPDQDLALGTVPVAGDPQWPSPEPSGTEEGKASGSSGPGRDAGTPKVGGPADSVLQDGKAPRCVGDPEDQFSLNAYVTGYANVAKLKSATLFPVACTQIEQGATEIKIQDGLVHLFQDSTATLDYQGKPQLPPATGTFLTFGFMPTTATLEMTQIQPAAGPDGKPAPNIHSDLKILGPGNSEGKTTIEIQLQLRLHDVKVNGVALDVGANCRTERPFTLPLQGDMVLKDGVQTGYTLVTGGVLTGQVTLPPFSGCGVGEDLDDLFTASISGVPSAVKQVQAAPCAAAQQSPTVCTQDSQPVQVPKPQR
ncbi:hypothetical protein P8A22_04515 [Streptomyces laculatispora]|uniref:DUF6801 domain-containing protein n=1 Tax=Streptomyces laculatispora TaxID=887464 RepID=A0ABY9HYH4_9ACTN|nr:DUF6801 domain-containing protein [Streptomyces laculatispora]WLQ39356.1 hypothetical protein P8A22_04515 [Streptomyces laculatispora]